MAPPQGYTEQAWRSFIQEGKEGIQTERNQAWWWGDLIHKHCPAERNGVNTDHALERWSAETGYEEEVGPLGTLRVRRTVAAQWPAEIRISAVSWTVHQILGTLDDRGEVIKHPVCRCEKVKHTTWTAQDAKQFLRDRQDDSDTRAEILEKLDSFRMSGRELVKDVLNLLGDLFTPIPDKGDDGREAMLDQLDELEEVFGALRHRFLGEDVEDALQKILESGAR